MRNQVRGTIHTRLTIIASSLLVLAISPLAQVQAQDDDLDEMMKTDPDKPADADDEGDSETPKAESGPPPTSESTADEERPPGDAKEPSEDDGKSEAPAVTVDDGTTGFELGLLAGYGISLEDGPNIWSAGFGVQAGYDLGVFVIGGRFVYYLGGSAKIPKINVFQVVTGTETVTANVWELSVEGAFDAALSPTVSLRPGLGFGFASASRGSASKLYGTVSPGAALRFAPSDSFYVGLDARFQIVASQPEVAKGLLFLAAFGGRV